MRKAGQMCILEDRICVECGECDRCELNPEKTCDNCCKCIEQPEADYLGIEIDDILIETAELTKTQKYNKTYKIKTSLKRSD